jgi:OOP family OmpA-OmpF porin
MKKIGILMFIVMMMAFVTAVQAEVRAGGLPAVTVDDRIKDCDCRMFPSCCPTPVVAPVPVPEPAAEPVSAPVPPPPPVMEKVTILLNVEFDTAKSVVKEKYYDDIKRVADFMKAYPETNAVIEGHTDNVGKAEYNDRLSDARAKSVRQYLIDKFGIDASRITSAGYGMNKQIASNDTKEGRQKNRRVEAVLEAMRTK